MYRLVQFLSVSGAIMLFTSYWLIGVVLLILVGAILFKNSDEKGNLNEGFKPDIEKERQAHMKRKNANFPKHTFLAYNNDILYDEVATRGDFHKLLTDVALVNPKTNSYTLAKKDSLSRIVGGLITFTGEEIDERGRDIKRGFYSRDNEARKSAQVPGFDLVKSEWVKIKDQSYPLYHRTHLVPFRYCLNDGEFGDVMFTGTARLNSGFRADIKFIPDDENHAKNVRQILQAVSTNAFAFADSKNTQRLSLDDFERAVGDLVHRSAEAYTHTYKYGVECFYDNESLIPSRVLVVLTDVTEKKTLFAATLENVI
jgi:hypothetical protein